MQFSILIDQQMALECQLNMSEAVLFSVLSNVSSWASATSIDGSVWYWVANEKLAAELPLLTDKKDTIKRLLKSLQDKGLINRTLVSGLTHIQITDLGKQWNRDTRNESQQVGKKIPTVGKKIPTVGKKIPTVGKKIPGGREKNPQQVGKKIPSRSGNFSHLSDNHLSVNQDHITSNQKEYSAQARESSPAKPKTKLSATDLHDQYGIDTQLASEYLHIRKDKRQPLTPTAMARLQSEAAKAGLSVHDAIRECCANGWAGFKAEWLRNQRQRFGKAPIAETIEERADRRERERQAAAAKDRQADIWETAIEADYDPFR